MTQHGGPSGNPGPDDGTDDRADDRSDGRVVQFPATLPPLAPLASLETSIGPGHSEWVDTDEWDPPTTNHLSPWGQVEHFGAALRSGVRRPGWQRTAVKIWAWSMLLAGPVVVLLTWLLGD